MTTPKQEKIEQIANKNPCLCFNIRKASRVITQLYDVSFRNTGYHPGQYIILTSLLELGPATVNQLAEAVCIDRTTLTRNLRPLTREGMVKIGSGQDRREKCITVTEKGKHLVEKAAPVWHKMHEHMAKAVGHGRLVDFIKELNDVLNRIKPE